MKRLLCLLLLLTTTALWANTAPNQNLPQPSATAIFAGGCFWCMQKDFDELKGAKGVISTTAGYTGGDVVNPSYEQVSAGGTGHYESVKVVYNPKVISYPQLLTYYWHHIDPTDAEGQFCDKGQQYQSVIFYSDATQKQEALQSKQALIDSGKFSQIATDILPAKPFYPAEDYHQEYYLKNPVHYKFYRYTCGRDQQIAKVWGS